MFIVKTKDKYTKYSIMVIGNAEFHISYRTSLLFGGAVCADENSYLTIFYRSVSEDDRLTEELRPQQDCPGIRCKIGKRCVPTKRRCDKYVDCMNAEDERDCDYTGSQYHANLYRSRNTDHSNLKYSQSKSVAEDAQVRGNVTAATPYQNAITTTPSNIKTAGENGKTAVYADAKSNKTNTTAARLNDTVFNAVLQLYDNQSTENTFSCGRYSYNRRQSNAYFILSSFRYDYYE